MSLAELAAEKERAQIVVDWIREALGEEAAHEWLWSCTPFPAGLPSDEQLEEGLRVAAGELSLPVLIAQIDEEMWAGLKAARKTEG